MPCLLLIYVKLFHSCIRFTPSYHVRRFFLIIFTLVACRRFSSTFKMKAWSKINENGLRWTERNTLYFINHNHGSSQIQILGPGAKWATKCLYRFSMFLFVFDFLSIWLELYPSDKIWSCTFSCVLNTVSFHHPHSLFSTTPHSHELWLNWQLLTATLLTQNSSFWSHQVMFALLCLF